ncbi:hypothetical protein [Oceanicola sp. 22II-s10i]|uniref:hypothetical protein n=1 Tax=Oceanicola sp. 22II-s10i TaxID=1317116 RepID=UPI0015955097|nr:hypothetical protein [Oceanicola sp. 22II-s10i]
MRKLVLAAVMALSGCSIADDLNKPTEDLGNFLLGHNVVVASKAAKGPLSRDVSEQELVTAFKSAIDERFSRYDGDHYYHLGVSIEGYNVAVAGVPVVAAPKSVIILRLTVWDDAKGVKLTEKPAEITVWETLGGEFMIGTGLTKSKEEQLADLAANGAKLIENYLLENREWFGEGRAPTSVAGYRPGTVVRRVPEATQPAATTTATPPAQATTPARTTTPQRRTTTPPPAGATTLSPVAVTPG